MNLVVITGRLSEYATESKSKDGQTLVNGCLLKRQPAADGAFIDKKFFFRGAGKIADIFLENYSPDDYVLIRGRLFSFADKDGHYNTMIQMQDIEKMEKIKNDME